MKIGLKVKPKDWPHGLRCADCNRRLGKGDRYCTRLEGMVDDVPLVVIVCPLCMFDISGTGQVGC